MQHTLRFLSGDDGRVLREETTLLYGLMSGYERGPAALGVPPDTQVRVELLDDTGHLLNWRTYVVPVVDEVPERVAQHLGVRELLLGYPEGSVAMATMDN